MTALLSFLLLPWTFLKIGLFGFGGGYAMMSMILVECEKLSITPAQFADLTALDMLVPGPIAINAATYVGYLYAGFPGALAATVAVALPSFFFVTVVSHFLEKYKGNNILEGALSGIKPAAVGLIAAAALMLASDLLLAPGLTLATFLADPRGAVSLAMTGVFLVAAAANIRFRVNPIVLTLLAGVFGAFFLR